MAYFDLAVIETGNGGDLQQVGNDLAVVNGIENMPYLAMFGGNPGYSTKSKVEDEQSFDWWGNTLLMNADPNIQFNSLLENILNTTPLTSSGRVIIEDTIKKDLSFLSAVATITVSVSIVATDHVTVKIGIVQQNGSMKIKVVNFRKQANGDFRISDFNDDFFL